jgi:aspartate aminotransferase
VISDEIYRRISYDTPALSILEVADAGMRDRLIVVDGVAKAYAMTGWRIGWAIAPRQVAATMTALQSHTTSNAASVSQHAALAALTDHAAAEAAIAQMVSEFRARRDAVMAELAAEPRLRYVHPDGAFYVYMNVAPAAPGSDPGTSFAKQLLEQHDVAIVPGSAFYTPDWVRMSYAAPMESVLTGARRVVATYRELAG